MKNENRRKSRQERIGDKKQVRNNREYPKAPAAPRVECEDDEKAGEDAQTINNQGPRHGAVACRWSKKTANAMTDLSPTIWAARFPDRHVRNALLSHHQVRPLRI